MLKSRSSGDNRSNSVETEERRRHVDRSSTLPSDADEYADGNETKTDKSHCLSLRNEQTIPSSPPPSYEHVLEEVSRFVASREKERSSATLFIYPNQSKTSFLSFDDGSCVATTRSFNIARSVYIANKMYTPRAPSVNVRDTSSMENLMVCTHTDIHVHESRRARGRSIVR